MQAHMSTPKKPSAFGQKSTPHRYTISLPKPLDERIQRAMALEGISSFADFARSALTHRCRTIERENGIPTPPAPPQ